MTLTNAVNSCLRAIGAAPVVNHEDSTSLDASVATETIEEASHDIQSRGFWFNEENNWRIAPNEADGTIVAPNNALDVTCQQGSRHLDLALREGKVYDKESHTFDLSGLAESDGKITFTFILELEFEDIPPVAQVAIAHRARRVFAQDTIGDVNSVRMLMEDEKRAYETLHGAHIKNKKANYVTGNAKNNAVINSIGGENSGRFRWGR